MQTIKGQCHECGAVHAQLSFCGKCGMSRYCSKECQIAHWPKHRANCKEKQLKLGCERELAPRASHIARELPITTSTDNACSCVQCGGTTKNGKLKACARCGLKLYCSKTCQEAHWGDHKLGCQRFHRQNRTVNAPIKAVPLLMRESCRIFCGSNAAMLMPPRHCSIKPSRYLLQDPVGAGVLRVRVSNAAKTRQFNCTALFSSCTNASSMSERLARQLGITKSAQIIAASARKWAIDAYLPSDAVEVCCDDLSPGARVSGLPVSTRMAFVILPNPWNELVLGNDWLCKVSLEANRSVVLDYAPDQLRIRFLPEGQKAMDPHDVFSEGRINEGDFIAAQWGFSTPGPG